MKTRFVDSYQYLIFDVCLTMMFGVDRFSPEEDFHQTYEHIGGKELSPKQVRHYILTLINQLLEDYFSPSHYESFPTIPQYLDLLEQTKSLPQSEKQLLVDVIALHEIGVVPLCHQDTLHILSKTHQLGIISNIYSPPKYFIESLSRDQVYNLFDTVIFSSEDSFIKPSPKIFQRFLDKSGAKPEECVYIGDSQHRDVVGAHAVGIHSVWISANGSLPAPNLPQPQLVIKKIPELLER